MQVKEHGRFKEILGRGVCRAAHGFDGSARTMAVSMCVRIVALGPARPHTTAMNNDYSTLDKSRLHTEVSRVLLAGRVHRERHGRGVGLREELGPR